MGHRLVEGEVLENLEPGDKDVKASEVGVRFGRFAQRREVGELEGELHEAFEGADDSDLCIDVEDHLGDGGTNHNTVEDIADNTKVGKAVLSYLEELLDAVVDDEETEDALGGHEEVVLRLGVLEQLDNLDVVRGDDPASGGELEDQLDHGKQVDVGVVDGEVDGDKTGASLQPPDHLDSYDVEDDDDDGPVVLELSEQRLSDVPLKVEVLDVASSFVGRQLTLRSDKFDWNKAFCLCTPKEEKVQLCLSIYISIPSFQ